MTPAEIAAEEEQQRFHARKSRMVRALERYLGAEWVNLLRPDRAFEPRGAVSVHVRRGASEGNVIELTQHGVMLLRAKVLYYDHAKAWAAAAKLGSLFTLRAERRSFRRARAELET